MGKTVNRISTGFHLVTKDEIQVNAFRHDREATEYLVSEPG